MIRRTAPAFGQKGTPVETDRSSNPSSAFAAAISRRAALGHLALGSVMAALLASARRDIVRAQATPESPGEDGMAPNRFVLSGPETQIAYVVANDAGEPALTYDGPFGRRTFHEQAKENALGRLITGYLGAFPDMGEFWLTLLLPRFNPMQIGDDPVPFATLAIVTGLVSTIAGPPPTVTPWRYEVVPLEGTAEFVEP